MTSENEDKLSQELPKASAQTVHKSRKFRYTKDFLLSLSKLDICKKLPAGFDESILSEFGDASGSAFEQQRSLGVSYFQSYKRNDYGTVQSNKLESSSNYSRGGQGRWDTRSSESSDREESQADRESVTQDSTRRYLNPSRRSWQQSEHDGLLGKPSGYSGHASAQRTRGSSNYQLSKSTEVYQPPKPYKAAPYSRNSTDSFNDETFGSSECSNQDRAEEEKRRRASFELMRREQHKSLQEKQKWVPDKHNENLECDSVALLDNSDNVEDVGNKHKSESGDFSVSQPSNSSRSTLQMQGSASRPLVPPGFGSTSMEKKPYVPSLNTSLVLEVENVGIDDKLLSAKAENGTNKIVEKGVKKKGGAASLISDVSGCSSSDYLSYDHPGLMEATEDSEDSLINDSIDQNAAKGGIMGTADDCHSTSILDKLFQNALTRNNGDFSDFIEHHDLKEDETRSPSKFLSSKFSHLFLEEDRKMSEDISSGDLLSLIVSNDKGAYQAPEMIDENVAESIPSDLPIENNETSQTFCIPTANSSEARNQELYYVTEKPAEYTSVLTCEDLEQSILAEANIGGSNIEQSLPESWGGLDPIPEIQKTQVDDHASQHLLSLLQKETNSKDLTLFADAKPSHDESAIGFSSAVTTESVGNAKNSLTLEALFGSAFMKELQSAEAPVSAQRNSAASGVKTNAQHPHEFLPLSRANDPVNSLFSSITGRYESHASDKESWPGHGSFNSEDSKPSHMVGFAETPTDIHLPEEENLITLGDSMNPTNTELFSVEHEAKHEELLPLQRADDILGKIAALSSIMNNERVSLLPGMDGPQPVCGPYDQNRLDPSYQQLYGRTSSPQFPHHQIGHVRSVFQQLDPHGHINPQMKFIGPDNIHLDPHHPFPPNMIHQHSFNNPGGPRVDPASDLQMLQHMPLPGNLPPYQLHGYSRPIPPSHPFNHIPPYIHEMNHVNPSHNFPVNHHQHGYGGHGIGMPGPGIGRRMSNPDSLQNMIDLELRANAKPNHPGIYGPEIDMGFRFR